jgi:hypothetical protein
MNGTVGTVAGELISVMSAMLYYCCCCRHCYCNRNTAEVVVAVDILRRLQREFSVNVAARACIITFYSYQVSFF